MKALIVIAIFLVFSMPTFSQDKQGPRLEDKTVLKELGMGKIYKKDKTAFKDIVLFEIQELKIIYIKNGGLHDLSIESIDRIEFPESKWGPVKVEFLNHKPSVKPLQK
jgi:hypothetical protein